MTKRADTRTARLRRWRDDIRRLNGGYCITERQREALRRAREYFGPLDNQITLLYILADIVFGKAGRPRGSKKWSYDRLVQLDDDCRRVKSQFPKLTDKQAVTVVKRQHPKRYRDDTPESMRQRLRTSHREYDGPDYWDEQTDSAE